MASSQAGVGWFTTSFKLDVPRGHDVPLFVTFSNTTSPAPAYRAQLYVNGYQFGKYANIMGPQTSFPVPEGILDYHGEKWVASACGPSRRAELRWSGAGVHAGVQEARRGILSAAFHRRLVWPDDSHDELR